MNNKSDAKLEAFASDDNQSNEQTIVTKEIKIENITSTNEYETDCKTNIKVEINVSDVSLHERGCVYDETTRNSDFKMDSKIGIKEEPVVLDKELQRVEYLDCMSLATKLESKIIADENFKMEIKMESIKQEFVSDVTSQNDKICISVGQVMKSDVDDEAITKTEIDFQSEIVSVSDFSQAKENEESDLQRNKEATSQRLMRGAVYLHSSYRTFQDAANFKPASGENKETSMRPHICSPTCCRKHSVSADNNELSYTYKICGRTGVCHSQLASCTCGKSHLNTHSLPPSVRKSVYKCDTCEKCFTKISSLKAHKLIHSGIKPHKCKLCDKCFTKKSNLNQHKLLHSGTKQYKCEDCEKSFRWKSSFTTHRLLHSSTNTYKCERCNKCYRLKSYLSRHVSLHSDANRYKCKHCDKCFSAKPDLNKHKLLHLGTKPYKCEQCDKSFARQSGLNEHKLLHSDTNPHKCEHCDKCFTRKSTLNEHKLFHSGANPYKCEHCKNVFTTKSDLNRHNFCIHV